MSDLEIFQPGELAPPNTNVVTSWPSIMQMAETVARSNLVPERYRGKPTDIAVAVMWGQEVGIGPMASLKHINVIKGTAGFSAEGMVALVRKAGHSIGGGSDDQQAKVTGRRRDTGDEMTVTFSMADAQRANLTGGTSWKQYPKSMLWSRAVSQLCRQLFPDVLMGLTLTPEEVESFSEPSSNGQDYREARGALAPADEPAEDTIRRQRDGTPPKPIDKGTGEIRSTRRPPPSQGRRPAPQTSEASEPAVDAGSAPAPAVEASAGGGDRDAAPPLAAADKADAAVVEDLKRRMNALGPIERKECKTRFADSFGKPDELSVEHQAEAIALVEFYEPES